MDNSIIGNNEEHVYNFTHTIYNNHFEVNDELEEGEIRESSSEDSFSQLPDTSGNYFFPPLKITQKSSCSNFKNKTKEEDIVMSEITCDICYENCNTYQMVYYVEKYMIDQKCCMQNYMCGDCFISLLKAKPISQLSCPFCRNPITEIETQDTDLIRTLEILT